MKKNKTYHHLVAVSCLALGTLVPLSYGDEKEQPQSVDTAQVIKDDKLVKALTTSVITPLTQQANRIGKFSRMRPTHSVSYQLVENSRESANGQRNFSVMVKRVPLRKSGKKITSEYLKLRYVEKDDQVLVNLKGSWVKLAEHPILKKFQKIKPAPVNITTNINS